MKNWTKSLLALLLLPLFAHATQGELLSMNPLPDLAPAVLNSFRQNYCPSVTVLNPNEPVKVYEVTYETVDLKAQPAIATGLIAVPFSKTNSFGTVSYQHGTVLNRNNIPSKLNGEGKAAVACYTAAGFMVVAADYLGYGGNTGFHPYLHADSEGWVTADMLDAVEQARDRLQIKSNGKLFLTGFSQGGHVTMALLRHLQMTNSPYVPTATAPLDGAYNLEMSLDASFNKPSFLTPALFAYSIWCRYNAQGTFESLNEVIQQPYADRMSTIFDGVKDWAQVVPALPQRLTELLQPDFVKGILEDPNHFYRLLVRKNSVYDWVPASPVRYMHASGDDVAPYDNAVFAVKHMKALGATQVEIQDLGNFTHVNAVKPSFEASAKWFTTF